MLVFLLGAVLLFFLLGGMRAFERARISDIKTLFTWVAALGGLSLALMMIMTGRAGAALGALLLFGPVVYQKWIEYNGKGKSPRSSKTQPQAGMTRDEAYQVLGLRPGASAEQVRAAHLRLMRSAHPDAGGSDWIASRINQARDTLLG